jgi:hypothetical protein
MKCAILTNGNNLNNVRHENSRTYKNRKREYVKENINELEKITNIRDLHMGKNEFRQGY